MLGINSRRTSNSPPSATGFFPTRPLLLSEPDAVLMNWDAETLPSYGYT
jgi:hypothetical protein